MAAETLTGEELATRAREGDRDAWHSLVQRFAPLVWATARSYGLERTDAAYLSQAIWVKLSGQLTIPATLAEVEVGIRETARRECVRTLRDRGLPVPARDERLARELAEEAASEEPVEPEILDLSDDDLEILEPSPIRRLVVAAAKALRVENGPDGLLDGPGL